MRNGETEFALTRRQLLKRFASAYALSCVGNVRAASAEAPSGERLFLFRYSDVKLTGGPLKEQFDRIHASYIAVDEDGLLKELRVRAGLPAPGDYLGGWYDRDGFAPGHCFGQVISDLARFAEATGDQATGAKAERLVNGFAATIAPDDIATRVRKPRQTFQLTITTNMWWDCSTPTASPALPPRYPPSAARPRELSAVCRLARWVVITMPTPRAATTSPTPWVKTASTLTR